MNTKKYNKPVCTKVVKEQVLQEQDPTIKSLNWLIEKFPIFTNPSNPGEQTSTVINLSAQSALLEIVTLRMKLDASNACITYIDDKIGLLNDEDIAWAINLYQESIHKIDNPPEEDESITEDVTNVN